MSDLAPGDRVRYRDLACSGIGHVRAVNLQNPALLFVEVEAKDVGMCMARPLAEGERDEFKMGVAIDPDNATLRAFWRRELEKR